MLPPGNTNLNRALPKLSPGEVKRKPTEKDYDYAYGHIVAGTGGVVDGAPGSGNQDVTYAEIDDSGVDMECVCSDDKPTEVTYSEINETCDTLGTQGATDSRESISDNVDNTGNPGEIEVDTLGASAMADDTMGDTMDTCGDTLEESDRTMVKNDLYSGDTLEESDTTMGTNDLYSGDTLEDSNMTMVENDLYSTK